jgi:hypothetical protein
MFNLGKDLMVPMQRLSEVGARAPNVLAQRVVQLVAKETTSSEMRKA